jgi:DNA repair ATPase RecN
VFQSGAIYIPFVGLVLSIAGQSVTDNHGFNEKHFYREAATNYGLNPILFVVIEPTTSGEGARTPENITSHGELSRIFLVSDRFHI